MDGDTTTSQFTTATFQSDTEFGSVTFQDAWFDSATFSGDIGFPGGPGRTTRPEEFNSLMDGLETKLFDVLPDETWIYPGHGNDTTIGTERPHLAEWRARGW